MLPVSRSRITSSNAAAVCGRRSAPINSTERVTHPSSPIDWSPTEDTGDVRAPWGVLECLEVDLYASAELVDRWAKADGSPLLLIGVFDSDGADVVAYGSTGMVRTFIDLEGYASSIFPGYAPFDDEGNMLEGAALDELEKESELEFQPRLRHAPGPQLNGDNRRSRAPRLGTRVWLDR
jgi:hypothetical protein